VKALIFSLLLCAGAASAQQLRTLEPATLEPTTQGRRVRPAPPRARDRPARVDGTPVKLSDYRGKVVVLEFGFSHCAAVCPVSLASLAQARQLLGARGKDVQVLFITVDPARDTAERLRSYLAQFDPGFIGITGSEAQIGQLLKDYGISAAKHPVAGSKTEYSMSHSSYLYFIDRQGRQRAMMPFGRPAADIAHDLAILLER
jgi:protein SCO1/2